MTKKEVIAVARGFTYKPGWLIDIEFMEYATFGAGPGSVSIWLRWKAPNSYDVRETIDVQMSDIVSGVDRMDCQEFLHVLFSLVMRAEHHEASEFFQVNGLRPFDPHTPVVSR